MNMMTFQKSFLVFCMFYSQCHNISFFGAVELCLTLPVLHGHLVFHPATTANDL